MWDGRGNVAETEYSPAFQYAYPTLMRSPVPDPSGQHAANTALISSIAYDPSTGLVTSSTDANGKVMTFEYNDALNRPTKVLRPDGGFMTYEYLNGGNGYYTRVQTKLNSAGSLTDARQYVDGLGRPSRSFTYDPQEPSALWLTSDIQYDALGRAWRKSSPYRSTGAGSAVNPSGRWTESTYDALGRVVRLKTTADNASVTTSYSGNQVTVTDQDGRKRRSLRDALGRITSVTEAPDVASCQSDGAGCTTSYTYDALGNLRKVDQGGQSRFFMYDSLSRLIRAKNPEQAANGALTLTDPVTGNTQWSPSYAYDAAGNPTSRTDARNVTTTHAYDNLNRTKTTDHSDTALSPDVKRHYDNPAAGANGKGRPFYQYAYSQGGARIASVAIDAYDAAGRPLNRRQHFYEGGTWGWGPAYNVQYEYNLADGVTKVTYPSGRTVSYTYNTAGHLSGVTGKLGDGVQRTYADQIRYHALGGIEQERFGTGTPVYNKSFYNVRGQLAEIRVSTYSITTPGQETNWNRGAIINHYSYNVWAGSDQYNNGNLKKQEVYVPNDDAITGYWQRTQFYYYDSLNRLDYANESGAQGWQQDYTYDRWGNRTINAANSWGGVPETQFAVDPNSNRLGVPAGQPNAMTYDSAGNLTNDTYTGQGTRTFDGEGRMTQAQWFDGQVRTASYTYDADGQRVKRNNGVGVETWQVYGLGGELLAEYAAYAQPASSQKEYGYRYGELLVQASVAETYVSDLAWASSSNGWGPVERDRSNGDAAGGDGVAIRLNGALYGKGLGAHAYSEVVLQLNGQYQTFRSDVGVDDEVGTLGSVVFEVWGDGVKLYDSGVMTGATATRQVDVSVAGRQQLKLIVRDGGDGAAYDHASWGGARLVGGAGVDLQWLVHDQLGTPRMIVGQAGTLASVKRRDFLPFGEELGAGVGGRTINQGYSQFDGVRQGFTGYEKDAETGLDYAQARYFASQQGRFTSVDPLLASGVTVNPKTWNRYAYALNNPLRFTDPTGLRPCSDASCWGNEEDDWLRNSFGGEDPEAQQSTDMAASRPEQQVNDPSLIATDDYLARLFGDDAAIARGVSAATHQSEFVGGGVNHTIHLYGNTDGTRASALYVPKGFTDLKYESYLRGGTEPQNRVIATNPATKEVLVLVHVSGISSQKDLNRMFKTNKTNKLGSRQIGFIGGPGGETKGYVHSHITFYKSKESRALRRSQEAQGNYRDFSGYKDMRTLIRRIPAGRQ